MAQMSGMALAGLGLGSVGTIISGVNNLAEGNKEKAIANFEADQLNERANQSIAASQRTADEQRRQASILSSRAMAVAAASGAGASDPTVVNIVSNIAKEGEYRALTALYNGEDDARSLKISAGVRRMEGNLAKKASRTQAASTILGGAGQAMSLYGKFGSKNGKSTLASGK